MLVSTFATLTSLIWAANALPFDIVKRDTSALSTQAPGSNWVKLGCYTDTVTPRVLTGPQIVSDRKMTNAYCQQFCEARGFTIAGTEWSEECYCDNAIDNSLLVDADTCDMTCTGGHEICGGGALLTVWQNQGTPATPGRETISGWTGQGCYVDSIANRALPTQKYIPHMTVEKCIAACFASDFKYAGVEYGVRIP